VRTSDDSDDEADRLRIDRWLWCARFFKSRSAAAEAVRGGHVRVNGQRVKPAHAVKIGDALQIASARGSERDVAIAVIPKRRGPAPEAAARYVESP
jgi:ribosome-associated heat shock protein Hsp15